MQCPIDGETLLMTAREGVEIDYCPRCRGVWLDRGELDKIIERAGRQTNAAFSPTPNAFHNKIEEKQRSTNRHRDDDDDRRKRKKYKSKDFYRKSKTKSFLKEIFDFD